MPVALTTGAAVLTSGASNEFLQRGGVRGREGQPAAPAAEAQAARAAGADLGLDDEHVGAERVDAGLDLALGAVADGDEDDHGRDADRHAEDRQAGAQLVGRDAGQRDAQRLGRGHAASSRGTGRLVGEHPAVGEAHDPLRAGGDVGLVGDEDDRAALAR